MVYYLIEALVITGAFFMLSGSSSAWPECSPWTGEAVGSNPATQTNFETDRGPAYARWGEAVTIPDWSRSRRLSIGRPGGPIQKAGSGEFKNEGGVRCNGPRGVGGSTCGPRYNGACSLKAEPSPVKGVDAGARPVDRPNLRARPDLADGPWLPPRRGEFDSLSALQI